MAPGTFYHATWMAIALLKILLFQGQFKLTTKEETALRNICLFTNQLYMRAWFTASQAALLSSNYLKLLQALVKYKIYNSGFRFRVASKMFSGHSWYISRELVGFVLFDQDVVTKTK